MEHLGYHVESLLEQAAKKELKLPRVPVHGVAAGMEREASAQYGVRLEQGPLRGSKRWSSSTSASSQVSIVRSSVAGRAGVRRHSENVILLGPPGVGKTHLAVGSQGVKRRTLVMGVLHATGLPGSPHS